MEIKNIKKGDFIELDYTGKIKDGNVVFDTTEKKVAEENKLQQQNAEYKPIIICVGEGHLIKGLDINIEGKALGKYTFEIEAENAFGKKSGDLLKLVPMKVFRQQQINPYPGLEINLDNMFGIVRSVSGGRIIVDFNHPLSSRDLIYDVNIKKVVTEEKEKVESLVKLSGAHYDSVAVANGKALVILEHEVPVDAQNAFKEDLKRLTNTKEVTFTVKKAKKEDTK